MLDVANPAAAARPARLPDIAAETPQQAARRFSAPMRAKGYKPAALHPYTNAEGTITHYRIRLKHPQTGDKWIRPMRMNGAGWELSEPDFPNGKPLYRLHELAAKPDAPVWYVEGENCADALAKRAVLATTAGSANSDESADYAPLAGRTVTIWPDNDAPGIAHGERVAVKLRALGCNVEAVNACALGLPRGGDAVDWLKENPNATAADLANLTRLKAASIAECEREGWPEPQPLIVQTESVPYPIDALPGGIGEAVREVVGFVQCPVSLAACSALSALSLVAQGLADVRRADKLAGPSSLYLWAIADSGERKTTCDGFFTSSIREWEAQQGEAAKPKQAKHAAETQAWEAKRDGVLTAIKQLAKDSKPTKSKEEELEQLEIDKPKPLIVPRLLHGDSTPEALGFAISRGWHSGAVISSEAGIVFGGHGMGRDSIMRNLSLLNVLWDGGTLKVDRRTSESYILSGARLTMGLAVQPDTVRAFFEASKGLARGTGFASRFLIAWPDSTQGDRPFKAAPISWPYLSAFHRRIGAMLDLPLKANERGELEPPILDLSADANAVWIAFHDEIERELKTGGDMADTRDVASKAADNAARLSALFHLYEEGATGAIGEAHMLAAARIVAWHLYEARRFLGELALPQALSNAARLDSWLLRYCREHKTASVPHQKARQYGPGSLRDKRALADALDELIEAGRLRLTQEGRQKRIQINPALLG